MTTYPDGNPGVWPIDPESPVGQFRRAYGDTVSEDYDPVVPGYQDYTDLSDEDIEQYLAFGHDSVFRAVSIYYAYLSGRASKQSKTVKDYDLSVDLTKRASDLRASADYWAKLADDEDGLTGENDYFDLVSFGEDQPIPELSLPIWGRYYYGKWGRR